MSNPCDVLPFNVDQKTGSSPTVLRKDHDVILAVPLDVGLALPVLHGGPPAPRGLPQGGPSHFHAGNGRASTVAPPEAVDLLLIKKDFSIVGVQLPASVAAPGT